MYRYQQVICSAVCREYSQLMYQSVFLKNTYRSGVGGVEGEDGGEDGGVI